MERINFGSTVEVSSELFDALRHAGLLAIHGTDSSADGSTTWPVWGEQLDDIGTIRCTFITHTEFENR